MKNEEKEKFFSNLKKKYKLYGEYLSISPENTKKIAYKMGVKFKDGDVIGLVGHLGSGKTYFIKGIAGYFGIAKSEVISPTFVLMRIYNGRKIISHIDLYRIKNYKELENIGYREFLYTSHLILIEWADKIKEIFNDFNWIIKIDYVTKKQRKIRIYKK